MLLFLFQETLAIYQVRRSTQSACSVLSDILGTESDITSRRIEDEVDKQLLKAAIAKLNDDIAAFGNGIADEVAEYKKHQQEMKAKKKECRHSETFLPFLRTNI